MSQNILISYIIYRNITYKYVENRYWKAKINYVGTIFCYHTRVYTIYNICYFQCLMCADCIIFVVPASADLDLKFGGDNFENVLYNFMF